MNKSRIGRGARLAALLIALSAMAQAQKPYKYDNGRKYPLTDNLEFGVGGIFSYAMNDAHHKNGGAQLLLTKRIGDYWRVRGTAEVNGFINNGFDRKGKGMVGISFDLLPFYVFADYGANYNPSAKTKFGLAMDAGAGLQFQLSNTSSLYIEGGVDRTNNGAEWNSNAEVKAGYIANLGISEKSRVAISVDNTMRSEYGELKNENKLLKTELQKCQEAGASMQESAAQMVAMVESLQAQLAESKAETKTAKENCNKTDFYPIVFDFASYEITDAMDDYIADYAETMQSNNCDYRIIGYCSANGTDWKNQILSQKRADAVYYRLIAYGVDEQRLFPEGKGMSDYDKASEQKVVIVKIER